MAIGFAAGRFDMARRRSGGDTTLADFVLGLSKLNQPERDPLVAQLAAALPSEEGGPEARLVVGMLARQRGEVDLAIQIHEAVLQDPRWDGEQRAYVELELSRDFLAAGLLGHAEAQLNLSARHGGASRTEALQLLLDVFERERDWDSAIHVAQQLDQPERADIKSLLAHYHCERAEELALEQRPVSVRRALERALRYDPACVRALLALAKLEEAEGNLAAVIGLLTQIPDESPRFLRESLDLLESAHRGLGTLPAMRDYLEKVVETVPSFSAVARCAQLYADQEGPEAARDFVARQLLERPSLRGLHELIGVYLDDQHPDATLTVLRRFTDALMANKPVYRCESCGLAGRTLHWQCPSCKSWGSVEPILGLEGD